MVWGIAVVQLRGYLHWDHKCHLNPRSSFIDKVLLLVKSPGPSASPKVDFTFVCGVETGYKAKSYVE